MRAHLTRRKLFATGGAAATALAAGCLGLGDDPAANDHDHTHEDDHAHEDDHTHDDGHTHDDEDANDDDRDPDLRIDDRYLSSAFPIEFVEPDFEDSTGFASDARLVYIHWHGRDNSHWHQSPLELAVGETRAGRTRFLLEGAEELPLGPAETFTQAMQSAEGTPDDFVSTEISADRVEITGADAGEGELVFEVWAGEERRWVSPPLPVEIA